MAESRWHDDNSERTPFLTSIPDGSIAPGLVKVNLLGPFSVIRDGEASTLGGGLVAALVALLAVERGRPVHRDRIIDSLWQDCPPDDVSTALRQLVRRARLVLGQEPIERLDARGGSSLVLRADLVDVDLARFEVLASVALGRSDHSGRRAAQEALAMVSGTPLTGLPVLDVLEDRRRAIQTQIQELSRLLLIDASKLSPSLADLDAWLAQFPDDEAVWSTRIRRTTQSGRHAEALRCAASARRALAERGLEPGPLLRQAEQEAIGAGTLSPFIAPPAPRSRPLISRDAEIAEVLRVATSPGASLVTVCGPPGIGTTSVVMACAVKLGALGRTVAYVSVPAADDGLVHHVTTAVGRASIDAEPDRWISRAVPEGAVLALDLADSAALDEIDLLASTWPGPILLAAHHPVGSSSERMIRLKPLGATEARELLLAKAEAYRGRSVDRSELADIDALVVAADGVPLVLDLVARRLGSEVAGGVRRSLPATGTGITAVIDGMVERLPEAQRNLLWQLVWADGSFDIEDAVHLVGRPRPPRDSVTSSLRALVTLGLVDFEPSRPAAPYRFLAPILSALRERADARVESESARMRHLHVLAARCRLAADAIGRAGEPAAKEMLAARIDQLVAAAGTDRDIPLALRRALVRSTTHVLITTGRTELLRRLLARLADAGGGYSSRDLIGAATLAYYVSDYSAFIDLAAMPTVDKLPDGDRRDLQMLRVRVLRDLCRFDEAHALLDQVAASVDSVDPLDHAELHMERGMLLTSEDKCRMAVRSLAEARVEFAGRDVVRGVGACNLFLAWCAMASGDPDRARDLLGRAWKVATDLGHTSDDMICRAASARFHVLVGDHAAALADCEVVEAFARSAADPLLLARCLEIRTVAEQATGVPGGGEDADLEAAIIRARIGVPLSPLEMRWTRAESVASGGAAF